MLRGMRRLWLGVRRETSQGCVQAIVSCRVLGCHKLSKVLCRFDECGVGRRGTSTGSRIASPANENFNSSQIIQASFHGYFWP